MGNASRSRDHTPEKIAGQRATDKAEMKGFTLDPAIYPTSGNGKLLI